MANARENGSGAAERIAVVSRDGVGANERLHRARDLFLFERTGAAIRFVERRELPTPDGRVFRDWDALVTAASGCRWIVALGASGEAKRELAARGLRVHEARGTIEEVIGSLPADTLAPPT